MQKWFVAIAILLNAKKSVSSCQIARDLNMNQKSAWYMAMRIRKAMVDDSVLLHGIVEACYKYNHRNSANAFDNFLQGAMTV